MFTGGDPTDYIFSEFKNNLIEKFALFRGEIFNCARQIKISLMLHSVKVVNNAINFENFWGWMQQHCLLRQIIIDSYKITKDSSSYLSSVLELTLTKEIINILKQKSNFSLAIKELKVITSPLQNFRNKRFAHLENEAVEEVILNLLNLLAALEKLYQAIDYIMHYLSNPFLIFLEQWDAYTSPYVISFEYLFEHDHAMVEFNKLIYSMNYSTKTNLSSELNLPNLYFR